MPELPRLTNQLNRAFRGPAWSGPALLDTVQHLSAAQAAAHPLPSAHSSWEIVLHLTTWLQVVAQRVLSRQVVELTAEHDWPAPPAEASPEQWQAALDELLRAHEQLLAVVATLPEADLDARVGEEAAGGEPGTGNSVYVLLHGVAQHNLYHAGQIALLRKALGE